MSRKLIAGFRRLLDHVCVAWSDAGFHSTDDDEDRDKCDREAHRARRKLERELMRVLLAAHYATREARAGWSVPSSITALANALDALEREARMEGRRFTAGHSERYATRRGA